MSSLKNVLTSQFKEKIEEKPLQYLDVLFDLLSESSTQAEKILQCMDELVKEKKLDPHLLYRYMEEPLFFQDQSGQDFSRREPLVSKIIREGGLNLFNHYLNYKYGSPLSAELLVLHDIFIFDLPPVRNYIDKTNKLVVADKDNKARIIKKYYTMHDMSHGLWTDILQEKNMSILKRLVECQFDFNAQNTVDHFKRCLYLDFDNPLQMKDEVLQFLLSHGLDPQRYLDLFLTGLWDMFSIPDVAKTQYPLIHLINILFDHNATLAHFSLEFIEKLHHILGIYTERVSFFPHNMEQQQTLEDMWYLQGQLVESMRSLNAAKPYYFKVGIRGVNTVKRKELVHLLETVKSLSEEKGSTDKVHGDTVSAKSR